MPTKPVSALRQLPSVDIEQVRLQFQLQGLRKLLVQNNIMTLLVGSVAFIIDLNKPSVVNQYPVKVKDQPETIVDGWLSWDGSQLLVRSASNHYFFLHSSYDRFKTLTRLKGLHISIVGFPQLSHYSKTTETGDLLLGTENGHIYAALIHHHLPPQYDSKRDDRHVKLLYPDKSRVGGVGAVSELDYIDGAVVAVIGHQLLRWETTGQTYSELAKLMKNTGLAEIISSSGKDAGNGTGNGNGSIGSRPPLFYCDKASFLYSDGPTVLSNDPDVSTEELEPLSSAKATKIVTTKYHILALSHSKLHIISKLAPQHAFSIEAPSLVVDIVADQASNTYWLYSDIDIFEVVISHEQEAAWFDYFNLGRYEMALDCLDKSEEPPSTVESRKNVVLIKQGYDFLHKGNFGIEYENIGDNLLDLQIKGIKTLAELNEPFEKVCLMLMSLPAKGVLEQLLLEYLLVKFRKLKALKNKIRVVVLSSWIIETMLRRIYRLELDREKDNKKSAEAEHAFTTFIGQNYTHFDAPTVYQIINGYNDLLKLIHFAELTEDFEYILNYYIDREKWKDALKVVLKIYPLGSERREIIYSKSTHLLMNSPERTVNTWLRLPELDYDRILPAVLSYNKSNSNLPLDQNQALRFLSQIIYEKDSALISNNVIYNFLMLLIAYPNSREESSKAILKLLSHLSLTRSQREKNKYHTNFLLRQCLRYKQYHAAVTLLINDFEMFEQAIELALSNELASLARYVLKRYDDFLMNRIPTDEEFLNDFDFDIEIEDNRQFVGKIRLEEENFSARKKLWLAYAKFLIEGACLGKNFENVDEENEILTGETKEKEAKPSNGTIVTDIIDSLRGKEEDSKVPEMAGNLKISKTLKYLLNASYDENTNSSTLTLKDLLPLFPEAIMVNNFKKEIIQSLNQCNLKIQQLSYEMSESLGILQKLKQQVKELNSSQYKGTVYSIIEPGEPCQLCKELLVTKGFVCFPNCQHLFHKNCLIKKYLKLKGEYRFKRVFQAFKNDPSLANRVDLDGLLLKECVLCNENNINQIDENIIDEKLDASEIHKWEL